MKILWLRPSKGDNISVRRKRIAWHLRDRGFEITIRDASGLDAVGATYEALTRKYDIIVGNVRMGLFIGYALARILRKPVLGDVSDPITDIEYQPEHCPGSLDGLNGTAETSRCSGVCVRAIVSRIRSNTNNEQFERIHCKKVNEIC